MSKYYGYVRVSTKGQNIERQITAMKKSKIKNEYIFVDKMSGVNFERPQYINMVKKLKKNDVVFIKSIDRLGRNYDEIIEQWNFLIKEKDVDIVVIDFPLLDTRKNTNGVTGKFLADMILQILSYVAQIEKDNTHQRQMEGIKEAKKKGIRFGRPTKSIPRAFDTVFSKWENNEISQRKAAKLLDVSQSTFKKWCDDRQITEC